MVTPSSNLDLVNSPLRLPCGAVLRNRICKSAMTELLADDLNRSTRELERLYEAWSLNGKGCGLLMSGNIQVDRRYMEQPGNVAIDGPQDAEQLKRLKRLAAAGTSEGRTHFWAQISHAGRQQNTLVCLQGVGPSAIAYGNRDPLNTVVAPRALKEHEIKEIVRKFVHAAKVCKDCGFTGVQIHGAHGYLVSSFLNPRANHREDAYGGSASKRAAFLFEIIDAIRRQVGSDFPIGVKMNSADFQKGGFSLEEACEVAQELDKVVDLLEISGGNYENPAMMGGGKYMQKLTTGESTVVREAYFLEMAEHVAKVIKRTKLMVTGGFRSISIMGHAIRSSAAHVVGIGRPLCVQPQCVHRLLDGGITRLPDYENSLTLPFYARWATIFSIGRLFRFGAQQAYYYYNMAEIASGKDDDAGDRKAKSLISAFFWHKTLGKSQAASLKGLNCVGTVLNKE